ncbi:hypothetical protein SAMN02949497_4511 [Methylomagnum ishizawai]|uniref:Uncharacterized protein n=1 Tax=Methylomagnum ishizawai TaxID=1760988 RepID=A0A1Y6D9N7_9GAMM|nr:hypothetical protein [Methylomagnum ishizawai]SMF97092.1 hypothetical protein SAMN02949497_4511 [Methylomagnum ishizawai]
MQFRNTLTALGLFLALAVPTSSAFAGDDPLAGFDTRLLLAKDEAKCETCLKKLSAGCDRENKVCVDNNGAAACQAYYEKCKESVPSRCGGPTLCGE